MSTIDDIKNYLKDEFGMDDNDIADMLESLFEGFEQSISALQTAIAEKNTDEIASAGHAIKGSTANIGAVVISEIGKRMEDAAKSNNIDECAVALEDLKQAYHELKNV